jgi:hypothetical protein
MIAIRAHICLYVDFDYGHVFLIDIVFSFGYFMFYTMYFDMPLGCTEHVGVFFLYCRWECEIFFCYFFFSSLSSIVYITLVFSFVFQVKCFYL